MTSSVPLHPNRHDGSRVDATFEVHAIPTFEIVYHHKAGARDSDRSVNADYHEGLELLLARIATVGGSILGVSLDSAVARELPEAERALELDFPMRITRGTDVHALRRDITRAQKSVARSPNVKPGGGNDQKRIRITIALSRYFTYDAFRDLLLGYAGSRNHATVTDAERHDVRQAFWTGLLEQARGADHPHASVAAGTDSWLEAGSGRSGVHFTYRIRQQDAAAELIVESPDAELNVAIYEALKSDRETIEAEFGGPLEWDRVEGRKRCSIGATLRGGGYRDDEARWPEIQREMLGVMVRLDRTLRPRIQALRI